MSGIIGISPDMKSGLVGEFPAGHILHVQQNVISGSGASTSITSSNASTWYATGNSITVSSANAALGSKILIMYEHMFGINPGSASQQITYKIKRTAPSVSDGLGFRLYDGPQTNTTGYSRFSTSGSIIDESLGSGDHTYALEYSAVHETLAATVYYNWYADSTHTGKNRMIAMVIK